MLICVYARPAPSFCPFFAGFAWILCFRGKPTHVGQIKLLPHLSLFSLYGQSKILSFGIFTAKMISASWWGSASFIIALADAVQFGGFCLGFSRKFTHSAKKSRCHFCPKFGFDSSCFVWSAVEQSRFQRWTVL